MSNTYRIKDLPFLTIETATGKARSLLESAKRQMGFTPKMYGAMANEPALYEAYSSGYAAFREECGFTPVEQEVIFLVISRWNECHYCIRDGRPIPDVKLGALAEFTRIMLEKRGRPNEAEAQTFFSAGYSERNILGIILAISVKTISNYANHVFYTPVDEVFQSRVWPSAA